MRALDLILQIVHSAHEVSCDAFHIVALAIQELTKACDQTARLFAR